MKAFVVLLTIALVTSSKVFLRDLTAVAVTVSAVKATTDGEECKSSALTEGITLTGKGASAVTTGAEVTLKNGDSLITYDCASKEIATTDTTIPCTITASQTAAVGAYAISKIVDKSSNATATFTFTDANTTFYYGEVVTIKETQSKTSQEVDSTSTDKKTFTVELDNSPKAVRMFSDADAKKQIPCTVSATTATCTPTSSQL